MVGVYLVTAEVYYNLVKNTIYGIYTILIVKYIAYLSDPYKTIFESFPGHSHYECRFSDNLMKFIADLHVHSRFSRATAKNLDIENLHIAAQLKGIQVVGTGDFTHPGWFDEINQKLVPAEPGLFKLREDFARVCDQEVPPSCRSPVRFGLVTEISNIYKKDGSTRKNHNLVFMPDLDSAARFSARLDAIGNIHSDGRPILGLDARDLLEITLETTDDAFSDTGSHLDPLVFNAGFQVWFRFCKRVLL